MNGTCMGQKNFALSQFVVILVDTFYNVSASYFVMFHLDKIPI